jgi:ABC-type transport system involved in multi-copper enzyme maturation permease subunit
VSEAVHTAAVPAQTSSSSWDRRWTQVLAVLRLEIKKGFRRPILLSLLAAAPLVILLLRTVIPEAVSDRTDVAEATEFFAALYQGFTLRIILFLGCVAIFGNVIRREILDRSLHYYFLSPIRREVLVAGKFLTGLVVAAVLFGLSTFLGFLLAYLPHDGTAVRAFLFSGPGLGHLASYLLTTTMAVVGYGSVFLAFGFFFKSPAIPALLVFGWEGIHFLLPPLLKKASVIHYLQSLCPVKMSEGPIAILSDAPAPWVSVLGLLALAVVLFAVSAWRIRSMEVSYDED